MAASNTLCAMDESQDTLDPEPLPETGACHNCGFLCLLTSAPKGPATFTEFDLFDRETGFPADPFYERERHVMRALTEFYREMRPSRITDARIAALREELHNPSESLVMPWCFRGVEIHAEIVAKQERLQAAIPEDSRSSARTIRNDTYAAAADLVLKRDRKCHLWMRYQPGLDPATHLNLATAREAERDRRDFQQQLEAQRQSFDHQLEQARRRSVEVNEAIRAQQERRNRRLDVALTLAAIVLAVLQVLAMGEDALLVKFLNRLFGSP